MVVKILIIENSVGASIARPLRLIEQIKIIFLPIVLVKYNIQEKWGNGYERIN